MINNPTNNDGSDLQGNIRLSNSPAKDSFQRMTTVTDVVQKEQQINTLDESPSTTIMRDAKMIAEKLSYVLLPKKREEKLEKLRNWDLWGPLLLSLILALVISLKSLKAPNSNTIFGTVFASVVVGSTVVTFNAKCLGGDVTVLQNICVLGYCIFPIVIATIVNTFINIFWVEFALSALALLWSTYASLVFVSSSMPENRKALAVYPIFLYFFFLSWFSLLT